MGGTRYPGLKDYVISRGQGDSDFDMLQLWKVAKEKYGYESDLYTFKKYCHRAIKYAFESRLDYAPKTGKASSSLDILAVAEECPQLRVGFWDIETTDLKGNIGVIIASCIKEVGKDEVIVQREGRTGSNDKQLCIAIRDQLEQFHIIFGYYSRGFDLPMLNTRLLRWGERSVKPMMHCDVYFSMVRSGPTINTTNRRLDTILKHLRTKNQKTPLNPEVWQRAALDGDKESMDIIVEHCIADVKSTEAAAAMLWSLTNKPKNITRV